MELTNRQKNGIFMDMLRCLSTFNNDRTPDVFFVLKAFDKAKINSNTSIFIEDIFLIDFPFKRYYGHFTKFPHSAN